MRVFVDATLNGASTEDDDDFGLWMDGIYSQDDVAAFCQVRAMILENIREAAEEMDMERVDQLDEAYDDISSLIELVVSQWPDDYAPVCLDESYFA